MPILLVQKPNGRGWRFVQDSRATNKVVTILTTRFLVVLNLNALVSQVPPDSSGSLLWTPLSLLQRPCCGPRSASFSVPADPHRQYCLHLEQSTIHWDDHASRVHWGPVSLLPSAPPSFKHPGGRPFYSRWRNSCCAQ